MGCYGICYGLVCRSSCRIGIDFQAKADVSREFFGEMEDLLRPIGFRKKYWWAKGMHNTNPEYVYLYSYRHFSNVRRFLELMTEFDPEGKFRNTQSEGWFRMMESVIAEFQPETA